MKFRTILEDINPEEAHQEKIKIFLDNAHKVVEHYQEGVFTWGYPDLFGNSVEKFQFSYKIPNTYKLRYDEKQNFTIFIMYANEPDQVLVHSDDIGGFRAYTQKSISFETALQSHIGHIFRKHRIKIFFKFSTKYV